MIRYHVRDLGQGQLLDSMGGINATGAAVFTEMPTLLPGVTPTNIAGVPSPDGEVFHFPNVFHTHDGWSYFGTLAGGLNNAGVAVGSATKQFDGPSVAIKVQGPTLLETLLPLAGFSQSFGGDINDKNVVVGDSSSQATSVATEWRVREPSRLDDGLPGASYSRAMAINRTGSVAGVYGTSSGGARAFVRVSDSLTEANLGPEGTNTFANDINDGGRVVGSSADGRAWFWERGPGVTILAPGSADGDANAYGVNNLGAIVGTIGASAFLWDPSQDNLAPIDLNSRATIPNHGNLSRAVRINDSGLILCEGASDLGPNRVYLLTPYMALQPHPCAVSDEVLMSFAPRDGVFGVNYPCRGPGDIPQGVVPVSQLCQLVSTDALECPGCMRLLGAPCGDGWVINVDGVPDDVGITLYAKSKKVADLRPGSPPAARKPFVSKTGRRTLEVVFSPSGKYEYFLLFRGPKGATAKSVFPVRLTVFRKTGKVHTPAKAPRSAVTKPLKTLSLKKPSTKRKSSSAKRPSTKKKQSKMKRPSAKKRPSRKSKPAAKRKPSARSKPSTKKNLRR